MSDTFDPYHKWLGIPPKDQPADHYRLLGVDRFESDEDVISLAADQRMNFLRTFQTGERSKLSQQLLNEVATARVCLLDATSRETYDKELREASDADADPMNEELAATQFFDVDTRQPEWPPGPVASGMHLVTTSTESEPEEDQKESGRGKRRGLILASLAILAAILVVAVILSEWGDQQDAVARTDTEEQIADEQTEKQDQQQAERIAKQKAEQEAEAQRKAEAAEAQRKAKEKEEAEREAAQEARRREELRKNQEAAQREADERMREMQKKRREAFRQKKREEARLAREKELLRQKQQEEAKRRKYEQWRKNHPDEYLESLGLVKNEDAGAWQLESYLELKEALKDLKRTQREYPKQRESLKRAQKVLGEQKVLLSKIMEKYRLSQRGQALILNGWPDEQNIHPQFRDSFDRARDDLNHWLAEAILVKRKGSRDTLANYFRGQWKKYQKFKEISDNRREAAQKSRRELRACYEKVFMLVKDVNAQREYLDEHKATFEEAIESTGIRFGGRPSLKSAEDAIDKTKKLLDS